MKYSDLEIEKNNYFDLSNRQRKMIFNEINLDSFCNLESNIYKIQKLCTILINEKYGIPVLTQDERGILVRSDALERARFILSIFTKVDVVKYNGINLYNARNDLNKKIPEDFLWYIKNEFEDAEEKN